MFRQATMAEAQGRAAAVAAVSASEGLARAVQRAYGAGSRSDASPLALSPWAATELVVARLADMAVAIGIAPARRRSVAASSRNCQPGLPWLSLEAAAAFQAALGFCPGSCPCSCCKSSVPTTAFSA